MRRSLMIRTFGAPVARWLTLGVLVGLMGVAACDGCGEGGPPESADAPAQLILPATPAEVSAFFAARVPAVTPAFAILRDPATALADYATLRPHFAAALGEGELAALEERLRATLGLDVARPGSLEEIGVAPHGGVALLNVGSRVFGAVLLTSPPVFIDKITTLLQAAPFELTGPVERVERGAATILTFRKTAGGDAHALVAVDGPVAFLFHDAAAADLETTLATVLDPPPDTLAARPEFAASVSQADGYAVHVYAAGAALADRDEAAHPVESGACCSSNHRLRTVARAVGDTTAGLRMTTSGLESRLTFTPSEAAFRRFSEVTANDGAPGFGNIANAEVYAFLRLTLAPDQLLAGVRKLLSDSEAAWLDSGLAGVQRHTGSPIDSLLPALGSNAMVLLTRARLLTLSRALNSGSPGEFFSGLGVVIAFELDDPVAARAAAQAVGAAMAERASVYEEAGSTIIEFTDADSDIGNIVITDQFALLVPARQRVEVLAQLAAGQADLTWIDVDAARSLVTAPVANGLYVDVRRVSDGPIGQVAYARLPQPAQRLLARVDRFTVTAAATEGQIIGDVAVRLAAPVAPAP